jgi:quinolinate synthase
MSEQLSELRDQIVLLKKKRNAVILAHNYQRDEVQGIADFTGDSLELARAAMAIDCDVIVFCGVHFMAESASILSPDKIVLLTETDAGCPMAEMIEVEDTRRVWKTFPGYTEQPVFSFPHEFTLRDMKDRYPGVPVVAYVNTSAAVKAASDICCTSANVVRVVESLPDERVICIPDRNLAAWAQKNTKKEIISWDGFCHVHDRATTEDVTRARMAHPRAVFMAHPECRLAVLEMADHVTSTSGMLRYVQSSGASEFIVGTELGIFYRLRKDHPDRMFYPLRKDMLCPNMKKTTLKSVLNSLERMENVIKVPEDIRVAAKKAMDRMLGIN